MFQKQENGFTGRAAQGSEASEGRLRESNLHLRHSFRLGGFSFELGLVVIFGPEMEN